jgi:glutamate/tyrosine decarboxylase-like PLP-dependent enzyme
LTIDPHKWLQAPVDCGALLMRHPERHAEAFGLKPDYLMGSSEDSAPWPYEHMFQLTYGNRALKTWAVIARLGLAGVRDLVVRCNQLAALLGRLVEDAPDFELLAPVSLSICNFRYVPQGDTDEAALDRLNDAIADEIGRTGEAHMPTTKVRGRVALRACVLHYENCEEDMHHLIDLARRCAVKVMA